jgi:hypothetical protein
MLCRPTEHSAGTGVLQTERKDRAAHWRNNYKLITTDANNPHKFPYH